METNSPSNATTTTVVTTTTTTTATATTIAPTLVVGTVAAAATGITAATVASTATTTATIAPSPAAAAVGSKSLQHTAGSGSHAIAPACSSLPMPGTPTAIAVTSMPQLLNATGAIDGIKPEDINNLSLASGLSEGQRSLSGAPSASSSPILSPQGKIFGRNANGTMITTSRPGNEAEVQLYRVLQRASLLSYYDTLLEMGGDDVQQLYDAGEEEFLEIMALVGMASKPLHVRRLQKALHEWANNPGIFQSPVLPLAGALCETPPKPAIVFNLETTPALPRTKYPPYGGNPLCNFQATAILNAAPQPTTVTAAAAAVAAAAATTTTTASGHQLIGQIGGPVMSVPVIQSHPTLGLPPTAALPASSASSAAATSGGSATPAHQVSSSSPQLTPVLTELQVQRITLGAEKIARQLPQREPRAQTSKKRTTRELEQVIAMGEHDPRRMDEIRKYSAIYGRFDCKRRPEKPLTLHEVCVNEAAAQLCRLVPALLTRRDELFPLARQIVKDAGFGHSASIARYGGLLTQIQAAGAQRSPCVAFDCESSDAALPVKRQRLSSTEAAQLLPMDGNREAMDDSRYNLFAMYQKFAKPPFDLTEIAKFSLGKADFDDNDNDNDNDSRFSFSNSSSPPMPINGAENERSTIRSSPTVMAKQQQQQQQHGDVSDLVESTDSTTLSGVQVISSAGGNIIAVANPALALSPTLNEVLALKRNPTTPEAKN